MELQDSVTHVTNPSRLLFGVWDQLKSTPYRRSDSIDSGHAVVSLGTGEPSERVSANPESSQQQVSSYQKFAAPQAGIDYGRATNDQLLAAAKASDGQAFEELSGRYTRAMRKRVYSIVRNLEDTEDVVQDSLFKAYRHLTEFKESCEFSRWISKLAINTALTLLRKRRLCPEVSFDRTSESDQKWTIWDIPDLSPSTERTYAGQETLEFVSRAVDRLSPLDRSVLEQCHAYGQSMREAAGKLGITVASVKSRLVRARRTLRSRLQRQQIAIFDACY